MVILERAEVFYFIFQKLTKTPFFARNAPWCSIDFLAVSQPRTLNHSSN
jgi:hypothetical protein